MIKVLLPVLLLLGPIVYGQPGKSVLHKISIPLLERKLRGDNDSIVVSITSWKNRATGSHHQLFSKSDYDIVSKKIALHSLDSLLEKDEVIFINEFHEPKEELTSGSYDLTLNHINYVQRQFTDIKGDSLNVI